MLNALVFITLIASAISGMYVMAFGDWKKFHLKFAGVAISTAASCSMLLVLLQTPIFAVCHVNSNDCLPWYLYQYGRSIALIIFHITSGRDAIAIKSGDRRRSQEESKWGKKDERARKSA